VWVDDAADAQHAPGSLLRLTDRTADGSADWITLAVAAGPVDFRSPTVAPAGSPASADDVASRRFGTWCDAVARGDRPLFSDRLRADGLDEQDVLVQLGVVDHRDGTPCPEWLGTLTDALEVARANAGRRTRHRFLRLAQPLPFEEINAAFVLVGRSRLRGAGAELLSHRARGELERSLLRRLTGVSRRALFFEFSMERQRRLTSFGRLLARTRPTPSREIYDAFVRRMCEHGLETFFREYPVLGRLMSVVTEQWVAASREFLGRLARDGDELRRTFGAAGPVVELETGLSDPHRGGRVVLGVTFASGTRLAYKSKDIGTERAFSRLLAWLNDHDAPLPFRTLGTVSRDGYGWVEWVEAESCPDDEALSRYYRRAGMLTCLVYLLCGTDCHSQNLIAAGEHPVLVDTESLMHHRLRDDRSLRAWDVALGQLTEGVLGTGLLPNWQLEDEDGARASDISALHTPEEDELVDWGPQWEGVNTDVMRLTTGPSSRPLPKNQPTVGNRRARLDEHALDVLDGFESFYRYLVERRAELREEGSPFQELISQQVRFIFRNTRVYGLLHEELFDPAYVRDGIDRRIGLERLGRAATADGTFDPKWWELVEAEIEAMELVDVPLFTTRPHRMSVEATGSREISDCLREPSAALVLRRLDALGPEDLERQLGFVAGSLHANVVRHVADARSTTFAGGRRVGHAPRGVVDVALAIADDIVERAIGAHGDRSVSWIAPQFRPRLDRYQLQPIGFDLHSGCCGVALFLAAAAAVSGRARYRATAFAALEPLREELAVDGGGIADAVGLGAATGLASVVYALSRISILLEDESLLHDAATAAAALDDDRTASAQPDVFSGLAGEILGQLALHDVAPDPALVERADRSGRRLLAAQDHEGWGWIAFQGRALSGFSHGAAGIAYSLARLYVATGDAAYLSATAEAIGAEDELFEPSLDNWPDLREDNQPAYKLNWCHGAPGIGLARIGCLVALDTPLVRRDIEAAIRTTLTSNLEAADHLCCGNVGRIEVLLTAGERLARPELTRQAHERAEQVVSRARATGGFALHSALPRVHMPGLFMGTAGIGYQLLRVSRPQDLPSILMWE
jgi:type 2 lantibiotic biosynthesis protein LanM